MSTTPTVDAVDVPVGVGNLSARFDAPLLIALLEDSETVQVFYNGEAQTLLGSPVFDIETNTLSFQLEKGFKPGAQYEIRLSGALAGPLHAQEKGDFTWQFRTIVPQLVHKTPEGEVEVSQESINAEFSASIDTSLLSDQTVSVVREGNAESLLPGSLLFDSSSNTLSFALADGFKPGAQYEVVISHTLAGPLRAAEGDFRWTFLIKLADILTQILPIEGEQRSEVVFDYQVDNPDQLTTDLLPEFSVDSGQNWQLATVAESIKLTSSEKFQGRFTWESETDLPGFDGEAQMRLVLGDSGGDLVAYGVTVHIDNNQPPMIVVGAIEELVAGNTDIPLEMRDEEGDLLSVGIELSTDGGSVWKALAFIVGDIQKVVPGERNLSWDTLAELGKSFVQPVQLRFTISDADTGTAVIKQVQVQNLLGDEGSDGWVGFSDVAGFARAWYDNDLEWDIGPAEGVEPNFRPIPDGKVDFEDLTIFVRLWHWSSARKPAGKHFEGSWSSIGNGWEDTIELQGLQTAQFTIAAPLLSEEVSALLLRWRFNPRALRIEPLISGKEGIIQLSKEGEGWVELQQAVLSSKGELDSA